MATLQAIEKFEKVYSAYFYEFQKILGLLIKNIVMQYAVLQYKTFSTYPLLMTEAGFLANPIQKLLSILQRVRFRLQSQYTHSTRSFCYPRI